MTHAKITSHPLGKTTISQEPCNCQEHIAKNIQLSRTIFEHIYTEKLYARLVAPNFEHIQTIYFQETFCSHCKMGNHTSCSGFSIAKVVED
jgi:hypothetical protein